MRCFPKGGWTHSVPIDGPWGASPCRDTPRASPRHPHPQGPAGLEGKRGPGIMKEAASDADGCSVSALLHRSRRSSIHQAQGQLLWFKGTGRRQKVPFDPPPPYPGSSAGSQNLPLHSSSTRENAQFPPKRGDAFVRAPQQVLGCCSTGPAPVFCSPHSSNHHQHCEKQQVLHRTKPRHHLTQRSCNH